MVFDELARDILVFRRRCDHAAEHADKRPRGFAGDAGDRPDAEVDLGLPDVVPGPGAVDHHRHLAGSELRLHVGVTRALRHVAVFDQALDLLHADQRAGAVEPGLAGIERALRVAAEDVATTTGNHRPAEKELVVGPENGSFAALGQLLVERDDLVETGRRGLHQSLVVDQADRLDGDRVAPGLALPGECRPGRRLDLVANAFGRPDRHDEPGLGPFADAVVRPAKDVRPLAGASCCLELVGGAFGVLHDDLDARGLAERIANFLQAVVTLVAVDPDQQAQLVLGVGYAGWRGQAERDAHQDEQLGHQAASVRSALTWRRSASPAASNR